MTQPIISQWSIRSANLWKLDAIFLASTVFWITTVRLSPQPSTLYMRSLVAMRWPAAIISLSAFIYFSIVLLRGNLRVRPDGLFVPYWPRALIPWSNIQSIDLASRIDPDHVLFELRRVDDSNKVIGVPRGIVPAPEYAAAIVATAPSHVRVGPLVRHLAERKAE